MTSELTYPDGLQADATHAITRTSNVFLDSILGHSFPVLDHGFIRVIDYMGDDAAVTQAARVSYGSGTKATSDEGGLIRYLMSHHHTTPFEMCAIKLHVKLPVFVARQWIRHRTANVNEYSARYSILDREFYIPEPEQLAVQSTDNKQGRGQILNPEQAAEIREWLFRESNSAYDNYLDVIKPQSEGGHYGLARELARMNLPTNIYTQWYWKTDLHNLLHFLRLRADAHAQYEIRVYAETLCKLVGAWVPKTFKAFTDYRLEAQNFSAQEMTIIRGMVASHGIAIGQNGDDLGMSKREIEAFCKKLGAV
jgi:thymidylate synthase (FAD)